MVDDCCRRPHPKPATTMCDDQNLPATVRRVSDVCAAASHAARSYDQTGISWGVATRVLDDDGDYEIIAGPVEDLLLLSPEGWEVERQYGTCTRSWRQLLEAVYGHCRTTLELEGAMRVHLGSPPTILGERDGLFVLAAADDAGFVQSHGFVVRELFDGDEILD
jgi:hypothetical protein